ncbi:hypothetical protein ACFLUS_02980 [Chloroflexota bacterium]
MGSSPIEEISKAGYLPAFSFSPHKERSDKHPQLASLVKIIDGIELKA